ncbi:MAG TPA: hypothetical protein VFQ79_24380 [Bryobacteraceae bacterium]|nr:hypothetical protein [Bryobacteraceae bacterium]
METRSYRLDFSNGLSATAVWLKALTVTQDAPVVVVLHDQGRAAASEAVSNELNHGRLVFAVNLLFTGDATPKSPRPYDKYCQVVATLGDRPLGLQAAQLLAILEWIREEFRVGRLEVRSTGIRNQTRALVAAALRPELFSAVHIHEGVPSLRYLLETPVAYLDAPELFCLDLYRHFDLDRLAALASPSNVVWH